MHELVQMITNNWPDDINGILHPLQKTWNYRDLMTIKDKVIL